MPVITLVTDLGYTDHYVAEIKAKLHALLPAAQVFDISHSVKQFSVMNGAFVSRSVFGSFPEGTIHLISVGGDAIDDVRHLVVHHRQHYFVCADNGTMPLIAGDAPYDAYQLKLATNPQHLHFPLRDMYVHAAALLASGAQPADFALKVEQLNVARHLQPQADADGIKGHIAYVDAFGNAISNIDLELFDKVAKGRAFELRFAGLRYTITRLARRYGDVDKGTSLAFFNSVGLLEIAINHGSAADLLSLEFGQMIVISFT